MRNLLLRWLVIILGSSVIAYAIAKVWVQHLPKQNTLDPIAPANIQHSPFVAAAPCTGTAPPQSLFKLFQNAPRMPVSHYTLNDLPQIFPAFHHRPFDSAGFNAVMLPFSYSDPNHLGDPNEAMALAAMISDDLDWSPGCYCARHAYFVFKRDSDAVHSFIQGYDPTQIASFINRWNATHAIGGQITRTPTGYQGKLVIYNAQGSLILARKYDDASLTYWNLLGNMDVDAMTCLDVPPSQPLIDFLHQSRCAQFQSVVDLGSAALMDERSPQEFAVYQKILQADPGFALVRHWYANQKHWDDGDDKAWAMQTGLALSSRIEPAALQEFNPALCPDPNLAAQLPQWLNQAQAISPDLPMAIACRLRHHIFGSQTPSQILDQGLKVASQYPNAHDLLTSLGGNTPDMLMAASLFTASLQDRYMPGTGVKIDEKYELACACYECNRDDITIQIFRSAPAAQSSPHFDILLNALNDAGYFAQAARLYSLVDSKSLTEMARVEMVMSAGFAAFMAGNGPLLNQILTDQSQILAATGLADTFQLYADALAGKSSHIELEGTPGSALSLKFLMAANGDALHGSSTDHSLALELLYNSPAYRLLWITEDFYEHHDPSNDASSFYEYLAMFYPSDPWVAAAIADFHNRGGTEKTIDPQKLLADLEQAVSHPSQDFHFNQVDWRRLPSAWRVSACVDQLIKQNKTDQAAEIARLYNDYESASRNPQTITIAAELLRRATQPPSN